MKKLFIFGGLAVVLVLIFILSVRWRATPEVVPPDVFSTAFGNERAVSIHGYTKDAMEPFISRDGQYLFWNSLNDAIDTKLFYAKKIDDTNFQFMGEVLGANGLQPHLDGVASMDEGSMFYWVSMRNWPDVWENYQWGIFKNGAVMDVAPVQGDFYIRKPGWIVMDAEISPDGNTLWFVNARFTGPGAPVESNIGIAHKEGNSFIKDANSETLLQNVNTKYFIEYAPSISADGLELFFTRLARGATALYVAKRNSLAEPFGNPERLNIKGDLPEAPSLTEDGKTLYYHKKDGETYRIYTMERK